MEKPATFALDSVKSPKSVTSPPVAIAIYSILFNSVGVLPPPKQPRVGEDAPPEELLEPLKSPNSCEFPVVAISTFCIKSVLLGT